MLLEDNILHLGFMRHIYIAEWMLSVPLYDGLQIAVSCCHETVSFDMCNNVCGVSDHTIIITIC